jgi:hypothetical protein
MNGRFLDDPEAFLAERVRIAYAHPWDPARLALRRDMTDWTALSEDAELRGLMDLYGALLRWEENGKESILRVQVTFAPGAPGVRAQLHLSVSQPERLEVRRAPRAVRDRLKAILFHGANPQELVETPGPMSPAVAHTVWVGAPESLPAWAKAWATEDQGATSAASRRK